MLTERQAKSMIDAFNRTCKKHGLACVVFVYVPWEHSILGTASGEREMLMECFEAVRKAEAKLNPNPEVTES